MAIDLKKTLDQIQAEFHQDAETLATLQNIYAEKVKQIRTNRALPPDIQQRFLVEWEQFYDQRVSDIFSYGPAAEGAEADSEADDATVPSPPFIPARPAEQKSADFGIETMESRPPKQKRS